MNESDNIKYQKLRDFCLLLKGEITFSNITEGTKMRYQLTGVGERRAPLGEIKLETKVGEM